MKRRQKIAVLVLVFLALATIYGFWQTREPAAPKASAQQAAERALVDQSPLTTAQQLAPLAGTHDERRLAQEALRLGDFDVDQAFDNALRRARLHPPALSAEAKEDEARLQKAESLLQSDQDHVKQLTDQVAKASESKKDALQADLIQAQADVELVEDEVNDAKEDLMRAGGDLVDRIDALKKQHEESTHGTPTAVPTGPEPVEQPGVLHRAEQWKQLHDKQLALWKAKGETDAAIAELTVKHNALDAQVDAEKAAVPELAHHAKGAQTLSSAVVGAPGAAASKGQNAAAELLKKTQQLALNQKILAAYDMRIDTKKQLSAVYGQWIEVVQAHQQQILHRGLLGIVWMLGIALVGLLFSSWTDSVLRRVLMDRRQLESLRTTSRVSVQVLVLLLILLVLFGPPSQLGTFLGLAGAGLTVALKDFIVGFVGWFVLMGKHGMRPGDWVEINGVTGEVAEIGPFHTVLLETGNWTDSGHPTGRRVTFTNSFAIEGHYFNFSTTGQWLWDELQVVLAPDKDPYPLIDALHKKVLEVTRETVQQAEQEWKNTTTSREMGNLSAEPAINVRPVLGGIEVAVRYVTRANERFATKNKLNQAAVTLLGGKAEPAAPVVS
ncbi:MAG TPA: mechanosensitive ion channel domain-containing protein [Candidatus Sulfotelmatobacter sp.]|nr:mechanosensitive ion channel domain-containing protein [Candidatus Sulfotelmatobacter sp.]